MAGLAPPAPFRLSVMDGLFAVCRISGVGSRGPRTEDFANGSFFSVTRAAEELSVVCAERDAPEDAEVEGGWRAMKVEGTLDFSLMGVLASISAPLADAGVSIFAVSTYETDYVLVKEASLAKAVSALEAAGHSVETFGKSRNTSKI